MSNKCHSCKKFFVAGETKENNEDGHAVHVKCAKSTNSQIMEKLKTLKEERSAIWNSNNFATRKESPCLHKHLEYFRDSDDSISGRFFCSACYNHVQDPDRLEEEVRWMRQLGDNDSSIPEDSVNRGVTFEFLLELCTVFNLWNVSSREVLFKFIIPLTSGLRCRFTDLPLFAGSGVVGRAITFVSHCWSAPFGNMVAGVSMGRDRKERVWIDILSVRQWPSTKHDLNFEVVIKLCPSFVAVCPSLPEVVHSDAIISSLPDSVKAKIPFFRVWCLYEVFYAAHFDKQITVQGGCHEIHPSSGQHRFVANTLMLEKMAATIDIAAASTTNPADRDMIFRKIEGFPGGIAGMNGVVQSVIFKAYANSIGRIPQLKAAEDGNLSLLQTIILAGGDVNARDATRSTALVWAANKGHLACVAFLIEQGADDESRVSALRCASYSGQLACIEFLFSLGGVELESKNMALRCAAGYGRIDCVEFLLSQGAEVNALDSWDNNTALIAASRDGYLACVEVLLAHGANIDSQDKNGKNAQQIAESRGYKDVAAYLSLHGSKKG